MRHLIPLPLRRISRRLLPRQAQFTGVYPTAEGVPDESPWTAESWIEMSRRRLRDSEQRRRSGADPEPLAPGQLLTALLVNSVASAADCSVLDFAGGSGWIYHQIHPFLARPRGVRWQVVDNSTLGLLGSEYRDPEQQIEFSAELPDPSRRYDIVHVNTSLQYVMAWAEVLERLVAYRPQFLVLTRLLAGPIPTFVTAQSLKGRRTPCVLINQDELGTLFERLGYRTMLRAPAIEEPLPDVRYSRDIPVSHRLPHSIHWLLEAGRA